MRLPSGLQWLHSQPEGRAWAAALPALISDISERWALTVGDPFPDGHASIVLPAIDPSGRSAVLKLQYPDRESRHEAAALAAWDGNGAVRLLGHEADSHALLIERCNPGSPLSAAGPQASLDVLVGLVPRLWVRPPSSIGTLEAEADHWVESIPRQWERAGRPFERSLVDAAVDRLRTLAATQGPPVLLHQDLHGDNVLSARREPWLVIDPKPLAGEREFQVAPIVRSAELATSKADVFYRLDRLCGDLGLDRERARGWTLGQTLAWSFENNQALEWHVHVARWMLASSQ